VRGLTCDAERYDFGWRALPVVLADYCDGDPNMVDNAEEQK
jgi:hypothetical protein